MHEKPKLMVQFWYEERGFDRSYYRPVDKKDKRLFCEQTDTWYICSRDGEPSDTYSSVEFVVVQ